MNLKHESYKNRCHAPGNDAGFQPNPFSFPLQHVGNGRGECKNAARSIRYEAGSQGALEIGYLDILLPQKDEEPSDQVRGAYPIISRIEGLLPETLGHPAIVYR